MKTPQPTNRFEDVVKMREARLKGAIEAAHQLRASIIAESPVPLTDAQVTAIMIDRLAQKREKSRQDRVNLRKLQIAQRRQDLSLSHENLIDITEGGLSVSVGTDHVSG